MKLKLLFVVVLISLYLVQESIAKDQCECPEKTIYNRKLNECTPYPSPGSPFYVANCESYFWRQDNTVLVCDDCEKQYYKEGRRDDIKCIDTGIQNCYSIFKQYVPPNVQDKISNRFLSQDKGYYIYQCGGCDAGYYMENKQKCSADPQPGNPNYVENCKYYEYKNDQTKCLSCKGDYYQKNGECVAFPSQKNNCLSFEWNKYTQQVECYNCGTGYTLVNGKCQENPIIQGCSKYYYDKIQQIIKCNKCQESYGYIFNREIKKCDYVSIDNCVSASYDSYNRPICLECQDGYYRAHDSCVQNPQSQDSSYIPHCKLYKEYFSDNLICIECDENYALGQEYENKKCYPRQQINHCLQYSYNQERNQTECWKCQKGFVSINGDCEQCPAF